VAAGAVAALFVLAAGLGGLELRPGQTFIPAGLPTTPRGPSAGGFKLPPSFLTIFLLVTAALFLFSLVVVLRSPQDRKSIGRYLVRLLVFAAIVALAVDLYRRPERVEVAVTPVPGPPAPVAPNLEPPAVQPTGIPVPYTPPATSGWLGFGIALLVIVGAGALVYGAWRASRVPENEIVEIARSALSDLRAGHDWEDVVVRCYADMSTALSQRRGIARHEAMTPREFAARLEEAGFPAGAVRTLTRLFEKARYSSHHSSSAESQQAVDALQAIMQAMESRR
jgi:hypothetical protein